MPTPRPFIPDADSAFHGWLRNFAERIGDDPFAYGLTLGDGAAIAGAFEAWSAAFTLAKSPGTRTAVTIVGKDEARAAAVTLARTLAAKVRVNDEVSTALKLGLGLRVPRRRGADGEPLLTRVRPPETAPTLALRGIEMYEHTLMATNPGSLTPARKPEGATAVLVVRVVADAIAERPEGAELLGLMTKLRFSSPFTAADGGKWATYFARWVNGKGQMGPWSQGLWARIAA